MPRTSNLSPDNILRFLQVTRGEVSANEIAAGLHLGRAERKALFNLLVKLKKRRAIQEMPGGRYRLAGRKGGEESEGKDAHSVANGVARSGSERTGSGERVSTAHSSTGNVRPAAGAQPLAREDRK